MTARDRLILIVLAGVAVLAAGYVAVVAPERSRASKLEAKVEAAKSTLSSAEAKLSQAKDAQHRYAAAYSSIVSLGQAVPAGEEVPSLIYEINHASGDARVSFQTISAGGSSTSGAGSAPASTAASGSTAQAGFQALPFTFTFQGGFFELYHLMRKLQGFTVSLKSGGVKVSGRLMTIQGLSLSGGAGASSGAASGSQASATGTMTGTVTATAYVLPAGQGLTAGATPSGPAGATSSASAPSASTATTGSSLTAPAIVKAEP